MAGNCMGELEKFIIKFRSLCESGTDAKLVVDAKDGVAQISLSVTVKMDEVFGKVCKSSNPHHGRQTGDSPCKKRRRERQDADRKAKAAAEQVAIDTNKFVLEVETQESVNNVDITEAIEENFFGGLNDRNVAKGDPSRSILVHKIKDQAVLDKSNEKIVTSIYHIFVKNEAAVLGVLDDWTEPHKFDDLAFRNAVYGKKQVKIRKITKIL